MNARIKNENKIKTLNVIGKIKVGEKDQRGYPKSLDYFRPTGVYAEKYKKSIGKTNKLEITFPSDNIFDVCIESLEIRTNKSYDGIGGKLFARGDGEDFLVYSEKEKDIKEININQYPNFLKMAEDKCGGKWYNILTLRFIILKMTGVFGIWQLSTKGTATSIEKIKNTFDYVYESAGTVVNIPFDLIVEKVTSQMPGSKNSYPVVSLVPNLSKESIELLCDVKENIKGLITEEKIKNIKQLEYAE